MDEFRQRECDVLGVSTDTIESHERWLTSPPSQSGLGPLEFPLASDPDGGVSTQYGVFVERQRIALRGLFLIDPNGVLQYQVVHSLSVGRSTDEVLRVLEGIQMGGLCPGERELNGPMLDVMAAIGPNRIVGQYRVEKEIGSGAFGTVFRGKDLVLDRPVALKVLRSNDDVPTQALLSEARAAAALNHPNVCAVYSTDTSTGTAMIVMEFVDGQPMSELLEAGPLPVEQVADWTRQVALGMDAAHEAGVVHGDLKPANLMVTQQGVVKIMDFGLARRIDPSAEHAETLVLKADSGSGLTGTPAYMAPELTQRGPATPASDVFALGLIMYEMLMGKPAVTGRNILEILRQMEAFDATPLISEVPTVFADLLGECLQANAADRQITMSQIAQRLAS